jgi:hypothetical protein
LAVVVLLAGCFGPSGPPAEDGPHQAFLTSAHELRDAPESETRAVAAGSFFQAWEEGRDYPTFLAPASDRGALVTNLSLHLYARVTGPVAKTFRFPDILAYGGGGGAWMALGNASTDPLLVPNVLYEFRFELAAPPGGLWVPAGERLGVKVVPVMHQNDAANVEILVGGATASALDWTQVAYDAAPATLASGKNSGDVAGSAYADAAAPPTVRHRTAVETRAAAPVLLAWMNTTDHEGIPDLDLSIVGPSGTELASSGTPTPKEMLRLAPMNLEGAGAYTLVVTSYGSARASFTVEWLVGDAAPPRT